MNPPDEPLPERAWLIGTLVFYAPLAAAAVVWIAVRHGEAAVWARVIGSAPGRDVLLGALVGLGVVGATRLAHHLLPGIDSMARALGRALGPLSLLGCLVLALLSGITEEMVFRAALQPGIGPVWATLVFAAVHAPFERDLWAWPLFALVVGGLFATLFAATGAALAPMVAHIVINAFNLRWIAVHWSPSS